MAIDFHVGATEARDRELPHLETWQGPGSARWLGVERYLPRSLAPNVIP